MKRILKTVALLLTLAALLSIFAGCFSGTEKKEPNIAYGKKYLNARELSTPESERYLVFESDGTGYYYHLSSRSELSTTFIWRASDDGNAYIFPADDGAISGSISYEKEFLVFDTGSGFSLYVLEGSDLEKAIKGD